MTVSAHSSQDRETYFVAPGHCDHGNADSLPVLHFLKQEREEVLCYEKTNLVLIPASIKAYGCTSVSRLPVAPEEDPSCSHLVSAGDSRLGKFGRCLWGVMGIHKVPSHSARAAGLSSNP